MIRTLRLLVTGHCNYNCYYCCAEGYKFNTENSSVDDIIRVVEALINIIGIQRIKLTGGEPLINQNLIELVNKITDLGSTRISIVTNGSITDRIKELITINRAIQFIISLPHKNDKVYDKITKSNNLFHNVQDSIELLLKNQIPVRYNVVLTKFILKNGIEELFHELNDPTTEIRFLQLTRNIINKSVLMKSDMLSHDRIINFFKKYGFQKTYETRSKIKFKDYVKNQCFFLTKSFCREGCNECPNDKSCIWFATDGTLRTCAWGNKKDFHIRKWSNYEIDKTVKAIKKDITDPDYSTKTQKRK